MPAPLLKHHPEDMDIEEFIKALAEARYIQKLRTEDVARGISMVFGE